MEYFKSFLQVIGLLEPSKVDFISELPPEVSQLILRKLEPETLLCAAQVSRKWLNICMSDWSLRRSAKLHNQRRRQQMREEFLGKESPVPVKIKASSKVIGLRRKHESVPRARFVAAEIFGTRRQPKRLPSFARVSSSSIVKIRKCVRI
ncbi:unnamed protein product [Xylocopa violacea]|uniref:F-box domain-containing protein n=1 Tax=Xylocopa violacea TaxID=135666 RepID=A0ABP1PEA6_XYLVO